MEVSDDRLGIARLPLHDGREVAIHFTWSRIDAVGRDWIVERMQAVVAGKAGCQGALTELLVLASGGILKAEELMSEDFGGLPYETAFTALEDAWTLARFGPTRKADGQPENPRKSHPTWWKRFWQRLSGQASTRDSSGTARPT